MMDKPFESISGFIQVLPGKINFFLINIYLHILKVLFLHTVGKLLNTMLEKKHQF